jgi:malonyl-CoA/methylmalonyl-CoA synthetase
MGMATLVHLIIARPPDAPAVRGGAGAASYGELRERSGHLAHELRLTHGVRPGARAGLLMEPGPGFVEALLAIWRVRAAALVLSPLHPARERARLLEDAGASLLICSAQLAVEAGADAGRVEAGAGPAGRPPLVIDRAPRADAAARTGLGSVLLPEPDDLALLLHTSGTTGTPKGVMLRHRHLVAQCEAIATAWDLGPDDALVHALPLHHTHGLVISLLSVLARGGSATLLPRFDAGQVLAACARASVFMGVPTMYARLADALDTCEATEREIAREALRAMRLCTSGSAGLPISIGERWTAHAGRYPVERFGMTELGVALSNRLHGERVPGSVGWPLPGVAARVIDETGAEADEGELQVAGETVFDGYWQRPEETAEAFVVADGVRWFRTGDTVRREADGRFTVIGRTSVDVLKSAGFKLSAIAIEEAIRGHPDVRDAAVVGLPDETYGQLVAAAVMRREGAALTAHALTAYLREELAPYALPRHIRFVDEVPRNAVGKVMKPALVAELVAERAREGRGDG